MEKKFCLEKQTEVDCEKIKTIRQEAEDQQEGEAGGGGGRGASRRY